MAGRTFPSVTKGESNVEIVDSGFGLLPPTLLNLSISERNDCTEMATELLNVEDFPVGNIPPNASGCAFAEIDLPAPTLEDSN